MLLQCHVIQYGKTGRIAKSLVFCLVIMGFMASYAQAQLVDRIVAIVNNEVIMLSDLNKASRLIAKKIQADGHNKETQRRLIFKMREQVLKELIEQELADQEIQRLGVVVDPKEVDNTIEQVKRSRPFTDEELRKALARDGLDMETYRKQVKEQLLRARLVTREVSSRIVITEEEIKKHFDENKDKYAGNERFHLRNIEKRVSQSAGSKQREEAVQELETLRTRVAAGAMFSALAEKYSDSPLAEEGGDLGVYTLDELTEELKDAVSVMKSGDVSPVMQTEFGYQIVWLEEIVETDGRQFEEVKDSIQRELYQAIINKKYAQWILGLRENAYIKIIR